MKDQKMSKQVKVTDGVNQVAIAVAGAVVGAGLAVAGVMLSDEKNREKIVKAATSAKDGMLEYVEHTQKQIQVETDALKEKVSSDKDNVKKVIASAKDSVDKTTLEVNEAVKSL